MASFDMYRWFSDVMNRVQSFLGYLEENRVGSRAWIEDQAMLTFLLLRRIEDQALYYTCRCMRRVRRFPKLWLSSLVGRNCRGHEKKAPCGKSILWMLGDGESQENQNNEKNRPLMQTCSHSSTCPDYSRIPGNRPAIRGP